MAGFAMGFEDGGDTGYGARVDEAQDGIATTGAIPSDDAAPAAPDQEQDNSGALPVADAQQQPQQQDNSGALPVADAQQQPQQQDDRDERGFVPPHKALRNAGRSVLAYLMGADAAPPQVAQKFTTGVKAEYPGVSDDDANVLAVHKALELGGPDAAWQMVQYNRTAYNAKQAFAFTALMGTPQKPADPQAAAQAATQASQHVLDGSQAQFTATPDGFITATVKMPGTDQTVSYNLSPEQFAQYLNVGKDGQWDHVMEKGGVPGTLQRLASKATGSATTSAKSSGASGTRTPNTADTYEDDDTDTGDMTPIVRKGTKDGSNFGKTPSTLDLSNGETETFTPRDDLEARATRLFPSASQGEQRRRYMATQMDQAAQGRRALRQAEAKGAFDVEKARQTGAAKVQAADVGGQHRENAAAAGNASRERIAADKVQAAQKLLSERLKAQMDREQNLDKRAQLRADYSLVNSPNFAMMDGDAQREVMQRAGLPLQEQSSWFGTSKPAVPAQQPRAMQGGGQQQQPAPTQPQQQTGGDNAGKKFFNGRWYTREEYRQAFGK